MDIPDGLVFDIALRFLRHHTVTSLKDMRKSLKLSYGVAEELFQRLREQQLIEVKRTSAGGDYHFALTKQGQTLAAAKSEICRYAGPAPVSLRYYTHVVRSQGRPSTPSPRRLRDTFAELVLADRVIDQLGSALVSHRPLFIYGPAGNGKTSIMELMSRVFSDAVLIPYAIEVDSQIVTVFDSVRHQPLESDLAEKIDQRWVCCCRPSLMAAGELTSANLNVNWEEHSGVYSAPLQMKAANGILCIDDFGRQAVPPRELLNRWILPLDRGVDYLTLRHGFTFVTPFELTLAFATNLEPLELADEAFLRRVPSKIFVGPPTAEMFDEVFRRVLESRELSADPAVIAHFRTLCCARSKNGLRGCYPRDILEILISTAVYRGQPVAVSCDALDAAADMYFAQSAPA